MTELRPASPGHLFGGQPWKDLYGICCLEVTKTTVIIHGRAQTLLPRSLVWGGQAWQGLFGLF